MISVLQQKLYKIFKAINSLINKEKVIIYIQVGVLKVSVHPLTSILFSLTYSFLLINVFSCSFTDPITWIAGVLINDPVIKSEDDDVNQEYYPIPIIESVASILTDFNTDPFPDSPQDKPVYIFPLTEIANFLCPSLNVSQAQVSEVGALATPVPTVPVTPVTPAPTTPVEDLNVSPENIDYDIMANNLVQNSFLEFRTYLENHFRTQLATEEEVRILALNYWSSQESVPTNIVQPYIGYIHHAFNDPLEDLTPEDKLILAHLATALAVINISTAAGANDNLMNNSPVYFLMLERIIKNDNV